MIFNYYQDKDGGFLGKKGAVIPIAEQNWDGKKAHGVGDYRIPKTMQITSDGTRIPINQVYQHKGLFPLLNSLYLLMNSSE